MGLRSDGIVVRIGSDDLSRPFCDLCREVIDDCLRSLAKGVRWPEVSSYIERAEIYDLYLHNQGEGGREVGREYHHLERDVIWTTVRGTTQLSTVEEGDVQPDLQRYHLEITTRVNRLRSLVTTGP